MTHDELLAEIDDNFSQCGNDCESCRRDNAPWFALRAVVELHKPQKLYGLAPIYSDELFCKQCDVLYPCTTIQAIEKELG